MSAYLFSKDSLRIYFFTMAVFIHSIIGISTVHAAPSSDLWPRWQTHDQNSRQVIDFTAWNQILGKYVVTNHPSGISRFRYKNVSEEDYKSLTEFLEHLQKIKVSSLNRTEQEAYWINLYNILTVKVILDHYPVKSIKDIDISPGWFSNGPWDAKLITIEEEKVSLNDIEHRILRPIFKDNRIHYAVNCASLGCPNLQPVAYTASNIEMLLEDGAKTYINSPRGAGLVQGKLYVSSIYIWFQVDFGGTKEGVIRHLLQYADDDLRNALKNYVGKLYDDYDWRLNELD